MFATILMFMGPANFCKTSTFLIFYPFDIELNKYRHRMSKTVVPQEKCDRTTVDHGHARILLAIRNYQYLRLLSQPNYLVTPINFEIRTNTSKLSRKD